MIFLQHDHYANMQATIDSKIVQKLKDPVYV